MCVRDYEKQNFLAWPFPPKFFSENFWYACEIAQKNYSQDICGKIWPPVVINGVFGSFQV